VVALEEEEDEKRDLPKGMALGKASVMEDCLRPESRLCLLLVGEPLAPWCLLGELLGGAAMLAPLVSAAWSSLLGLAVLKNHTPEGLTAPLAAPAAAPLVAAARVAAEGAAVGVVEGGAAARKTGGGGGGGGPGGGGGGGLDTL
jgi:hypothetical protein